MKENEDDIMTGTGLRKTLFANWGLTRATHL